MLCTVPGTRIRPCLRKKCCEGVFQRAVRQLYGVIVAGFNDDPRPVSIEGFANTDIAGSLLSYPVEILPGGIKQRRFTPAICSKVFGVTCDKPALVRRNRPAGRFPIFKAEIE